MEVQVLEADNRFPDSVFVEDVALCTSDFAVITNPGAPSRNGEKEGMKEVLSDYFHTLECIRAPGTLDAGDVMMCGRAFYIGISDRTNDAGAGQLIRILETHGRSGIKVPLRNMLHLKSGLSYLENNTLLITRELSKHPLFASFRKIVVEAEEGYAANSLWVNGTVLVATGFPQTRNAIEKAAYPTLELDVSEYRKLDGGLSCLSLRF
jgi:dimethylargininase